MKRFVLLGAVTALAVAAPAFAKGPSAASIDGPGTGGGISITGDGESGGTPLGDLTEQSGFFAAMFGQSPDPMLAKRPTGNLGPKYTITWTVPGPEGTDTIRSELYPYAKGGPVVFTEPGQRFFGVERTRGGWYVASPALKELLVDAGLPAQAPSGGDGFALPPWAIALLALLGALLLGGASALLVRRRRIATA